MTRVYLERDGNACAVDARGHATTKEMCAAVSCLLFTLAGWLHNSGAEIVTERLESGSARLAWRGQTDVAFEMMEIGFLQLRETDPDGITVEISDG